MQTESSAIQFHRVVSAAEPAFYGLLSIYEEALPASERKSSAKLAAMVERSDYSILTASINNSVVAFSISLRFANSDGSLLEYMAVETHLRGRGIGQRLFRGTVMLDELADRYLLIEVDSDKRPGDSQLKNARRKSFYKKLGCREIEHLAYVMPPVASSAPPPMNLLVYRRFLPSVIEKTRLRSWLSECYSQVYGASANSPVIESMLSDLPDGIRLI